MPVPVGNYEVGKQLRDIANIQSFPITLSETVLPVIVSNPSNFAVVSAQTDRGSLAIQTGSGVFGGTGTQSRVYSVPNGKKWVLKWAFFNTLATLGGNCYIEVLTPTNTTVILAEYASTTTSGSLQIPSIVLPQGWSVRFRYNIGVDGSTYNSLLYSEYIEAQ